MELERLTELLDIISIRENTNIWMIRTKRGFFFDEFIKQEFIAIGWNLISKSNLSENLALSHINALKKNIQDTYDESKPGTALNKCMRFCFELKSGDIAVIVGNNQIAFAYIGDYYEENTCSPELEINIHRQIEGITYKNTSFPCPYKKRRKISIIKILNSKSNISPYLQTAIAGNHHSLSDLSDYAEIIFCSCFDSFIFENKLFLTCRVMSNNGINALDLTNFVVSASEFLSGGDIRKIEIKTAFRSPGEISLIGQCLDNNYLNLVLCYCAIFGGKVPFFEIPSIFSVISAMLDVYFGFQEKKEKLRKLKAEADLAELKVFEETYERLRESSINLQIEPNRHIQEKMQNFLAEAKSEQKLSESKDN